MVLHPSFHVVIQVSCNPPKSIVRSGGKIRVIFVSWGRGLIFRFFFGGDCCHVFFFGAGLLREMCRGVFPKIVEMLCVLHESVQPCSGGLLCGVPYVRVSFRLGALLDLPMRFLSF